MRRELDDVGGAKELVLREQLEAAREIVAQVDGYLQKILKDTES